MGVHAGTGTVRVDYQVARDKEKPIFEKYQVVDSSSNLTLIFS
jgi:hypothetical protein